jgi:hypothetical protein
MIKLRRLRWAGNAARMGEKRNSYSILVGKPEGKRTLGRRSWKWVDNIKMDLREIGWGVMVWIDLAQDRDQWRARVNIVNTSGSVKSWEILELMHNWRFLKKS